MYSIYCIQYRHMYFPNVNLVVVLFCQLNGKSFQSARSSFTSICTTDVSCTKLLFLLHTLPSIVPHDFCIRNVSELRSKGQNYNTKKTTLFLRLLQSSKNQLGQCLFNNLFGKESSAPCATAATDQYYYQYFYYDYYTCARYRLLPTAAVLLLPSNHDGSRSGSRRRAKSTFSLLCSLSLEYLARKCHRVETACHRYINVGMHQYVAASLFIGGPCLSPRVYVSGY